MSDLPIILALLAVAWCAWLRPWVGVLGLVFVGIMHPQAYATGWLRGAPVYAAIGAVVALSTVRQLAVQRKVPPLFWDWRFAIAALLGLQMVLSTWLGIIPAAGWIRLSEIAKSVPVLVLALWLIDDRDKLRYLIITIALSIAVVVLKGGYWALFMGFGERVYGPPGTEYGDNNAFAVAASVAIPLLVWWLRESTDHRVRWFLGVLVFLSFTAVLSSWSRGGLLCLATLALLLTLHSRRKWVALPILLVGVGAVWLALPDAWLARMQTLLEPAAEGSAAARLGVWRLGIDYAMEHPWFGGGFGGLIYLTQPTGDVLAWHSAYVQIAAEHGFVGLALWCALLFGTIASLSWMLWAKRTQRIPWVADQAAMLRASLAAYAVGSAFLSIAYWELLFLVIVASILTTRFARLESGLLGGGGSLEAHRPVSTNFTERGVAPSNADAFEPVPRASARGRGAGINLA